MSILIEGMAMPTSCCQCPVNMEVCKRGYEYLLSHPELYDKRADDCPIVEIPPHGDLIERKAAYDSLLDGMVMTGYQSRALDCISDFCVPTILPAEEGE